MNSNNDASWAGSCTAGPDGVGRTGVQLPIQQGRASSRKRANPYLQALLTYPRRVRSWARIGYLIVGGMLLLLASVIPVLVGKSPQFFLMVTLYLFLPLAFHVKEQFASPRAYLMPGFLRVHASVAGGLVLLLAVLMPAMLTWLSGSHSIGLVALTVCMLGTTLWLVLLCPALWGLLVTAGVFAMIGSPGQRAIGQLVSGQFEVQAYILLALGETMTLWAGTRVTRLNEEMPEYHRRMPSLSGGSTEMTAGRPAAEGRFLRGLRGWIAEWQMARLTRHACHASTSWWSRACRWQVGMPFGWSSVAPAINVIFWLQLVIWVGGPKISPVPMIVFCLAVLPACVLFGVLTSRKRTLPFELMMPVERATYLRQLAVAAGLSGIQLWSALAIAATVWWLLVLRQSLPLAAVGDLLLVSASFQVCMFGSIAWLARCRTWLTGMMAVGAAVGVMMPLVMTISDAGTPADWQPLAWLAAAVFAVVGVVLIWTAYRRWLAADFD